MTHAYTLHPHFETYAQRDARLFRETVASTFGKTLDRRHGRRVLFDGTVETYVVES